MGLRFVLAAFIHHEGTGNLSFAGSAKSGGIVDFPATNFKFANQNGKVVLIGTYGGPQPKDALHPMYVELRGAGSESGGPVTGGPTRNPAGLSGR